jgi:competence protein ComFB
MEETVLRIVDDVCNDDELTASRKYCTSADCRMDAACYVLNRIPQRYVSSQRGEAYTEQEIQHDEQLYADIVTLTHEALRRVSSVRRSFYGDGDVSVQRVLGPHFYMPMVKGRLLDGMGFEPVADVSVLLLLDDNPVPMLDSRWQNPYHLASNIAGTFVFWPEPVAADRDGVERRFEFEIRIDSVGFEPFKHYFAIDRTSITHTPDVLEMGGEHRLPDLYLLPA